VFLNAEPAACGTSSKRAWLIWQWFRVAILLCP
jgi:hypothetical protein